MCGRRRSRPAARTMSQVTLLHTAFSHVQRNIFPLPSPQASPPPWTSYLVLLSQVGASAFSPSFIKFTIMYRQSFAPPPAHSPPLHHPVPQHVSTVPMMRSPPPPTSQQPQTSAYGNPYQPAPAQGGSGTYAPGFGGFINDPTAQMGFHMGKTAVAAGQEYMEQNVC